MIYASPQTIELIAAESLDHPEGIAIAEDGTLYAGGEAGQVYRISRDGTIEMVAQTGGFLHGVALDGDGNLHICDPGRPGVLQVDPATGAVMERSRGTAQRPMRAPNHLAFDAAGNLYVSDSGDYWSETGTGCIYVIRPNGATELFHPGPFRYANGLAVSPDGAYLYVAQSAAWNVVRIPLNRPNGAVEAAFPLPDHSVPDGLAFTSAGTLVITCYRPDIVYLGYPDGTVDVLIEDLTAEFLMRPTNVALYKGNPYFANLGGWHIARAHTIDLGAACLYRPRLTGMS